MTTDIILGECIYVLGLMVNFFSLMKAIDNGWDISNKGIKINLNKSNVNITFDKVLKTDNDHVLGVEMIPRGDTAHILLEQGRK